MEIENLIWLVVPVVVSALACLVFKDSIWLPKGKFLLAGAALGLIGPLLGPTALCSDSCSILTAAFLTSFVMSLVVFTGGVGACYLLCRVKPS